MTDKDKQECTHSKCDPNSAVCIIFINRAVDFLLLPLQTAQQVGSLSDTVIYQEVW